MSSFVTERSDTATVSVAAPPRFVFQVLARVADWPQFSPFARAVEPVGDGRCYWVTTPDSTVRLVCQFDPDLLLLDHQVAFADGSSVFIPYRVVPNGTGAELIMTNVKSPADSVEDYRSQLGWMRTELIGARDWVLNHLARASTGGSR